MKLLSSILAFLILALSCIPCSDAETAMATTAITITTTSVPAVSGHTGQEHEDEDLCSPFCQCSCCAIAYTIAVVPFSDILLKPGFPAKTFAAYLQHKPVGISLPVWQPPRTSVYC